MKTKHYSLSLLLAIALCGVAVWGNYYKNEAILSITKFNTLQIISNHAIEAGLNKNNLLERLENIDDFQIKHESDSVIILKYNKEDIRGFRGIRIETNDSLIVAVRLNKL